MDLIPDEQQQQITEMAASYLANELPLARFNVPPQPGAAATNHRAFGAMGWLSMTLRASAGGAELGVVEEMLVVREIGRVIGPMSVIPAILAAKLADALDLVTLRDAIASGQTGVALAVAEEPLVADATHVTGRARVYCVNDAQVIVVEVGTEVLLLDSATGPLAPVPWLDPDTAVAVCDLSAFAILARTAGAATRLDGMLLSAAMLVGLAEGANAMVLDYAKIRETFGRKIGAYQAVRHPIAECAARSEQARCLVFFAALAIPAARADAELQVRSAKVIAHRAAMRSADVNIQLHGAIGITHDLAAHRFLKRALMLGNWFGDRKAHLDAILDAPLLAI